MKGSLVCQCMSLHLDAQDLGPVIMNGFGCFQALYIMCMLMRNGLLKSIIEDAK